MKNKLQDLFPMIRTRESILREIEDTPKLKKQFVSWAPEYQQEFLDFLSGAKGVRILYDSFFKAIMDPERDPARLSDFLSLIMKRQVCVLSVLPHEGGRVTPETLIVMDIIVKLEDGSITTVEVQRYGYAFPGQRAACYSADMLLRQYKKKRDQASDKGTRVDYKRIRPVYTVVLYELSPDEFRKYPENYIHYFQQTSDTGLKLELLEKYIFISLDILKEILQNRGIRDRLEAWLAFLCMDEPEWILRLTQDYPEFKDMYAELYRMCLDLEGVMSMYSKELQEMDRNTVYYMMDEMQAKIDRKDMELTQKDNLISELQQKIRELENR